MIPKDQAYKFFSGNYSTVNQKVNRWKRKTPIIPWDQATAARPRRHPSQTEVMTITSRSLLPAAT
jgi:hypothetical protein